MFGSVQCKICVRPVYRMDPLINLDGSIIHKQCAKCGDCNCQITLSNFVKNEIGETTKLLCKIHYLKRFNEGGVGYPGGEKFKMKSSKVTSGEVSTSASLVTLASANGSTVVDLPIVAVSDSSGFARMNSSASVAVALSTDQWENKKNMIGDDEEPNTSETTMESGPSTAQVSPVGDAPKSALSAFLQSTDEDKSKPLPEASLVETSAPSQTAPGAEPGTVKSFLKLFSGTGKAPVPQPAGQVRQHVVKREQLLPDSCASTSGEERPKSWRSEVPILPPGEPASGTKSVLSRYSPNNGSEKSYTSPVRSEPKPLTVQSSPGQKASWAVETEC